MCIAFSCFRSSRWSSEKVSIFCIIWRMVDAKQSSMSVSYLLDIDCTDAIGIPAEMYFGLASSLSWLCLSPNSSSSRCRRWWLQQWSWHSVLDSWISIPLQSILRLWILRTGLETCQHTVSDSVDGSSKVISPWLACKVIFWSRSVSSSIKMALYIKHIWPKFDMIWGLHLFCFMLQHWMSSQTSCSISKQSAS